MAFSIVPVTAADASFSTAGAAAWAAGMTVSGATVGGIPYCPTAASIVTGSGFVFNASGVAGDGLAISAGTATTDRQALSVTQTWNASVNFTAFKYSVIDTSSGGSALHSAWYGGSAGTTALMTLSKAGAAVFASSVTGYGVIVSNGQNLVFSSYGILAPSGSDGNFAIYNSSANNFGRLMFGGTTSSFPALKRSTTILQARLADDSGFASFQGKLTTDTAYVATPQVSTGYIVIYDSTGTAYKVSCNA